MSRRTRTTKTPRPEPVFSLQDLTQVEGPVYYEIQALSSRGERHRIYKWSNEDPLTYQVSVFNPARRQWQRIFTARITVQGLQRAADRLERIKKGLAGIMKLAKEGKIPLVDDTQPEKEIPEEEEVFQ